MFRNLSFCLQAACHVWQKCFYWKPCYVFLQVLLLGTSKHHWPSSFCSVSISLFSVCSPSLSFIYYCLFFSLFHFALLTAQIPVFLLIANASEKPKSQQIHLHLSLTARSLFVIFGYLRLMNCGLCRKEVAKRGGLGWKGSLLTPRSPWTQMLLIPSPVHLHLQPWSLTVSTAITTRINTLPLIIFFCLR